jgi:hypothetical protein
VASSSCQRGGSWIDDGEALARRAEMCAHAAQLDRLGYPPQRQVEAAGELRGPAVAGRVDRDGLVEGRRLAILEDQREAGARGRIEAARRVDVGERECRVGHGSSRG